MTDITHMCKQSVPGHFFVAWLQGYYFTYFMWCSVLFIIIHQHFELYFDSYHTSITSIIIISWNIGKSCSPLSLSTENPLLPSLEQTSWNVGNSVFVVIEVFKRTWNFRQLRTYYTQWHKQSCPQCRYAASIPILRVSENEREERERERERERVERERVRKKEREREWRERERERERGVSILRVSEKREREREEWERKELRWEREKREIV